MANKLRFLSVYLLAAQSLTNENCNFNRTKWHIYLTYDSVADRKPTRYFIFCSKLKIKLSSTNTAAMPATFTVTKSDVVTAASSSDSVLDYNEKWLEGVCGNAER